MESKVKRPLTLAERVLQSHCFVVVLAYLDHWYCLQALNKQMYETLPERTRFWSLPARRASHHFYRITEPDSGQGAYSLLEVKFKPHGGAVAVEQRSRLLDLPYKPCEDGPECKDIDKFQMIQTGLIRYGQRHRDRKLMIKYCRKSECYQQEGHQGGIYEIDENGQILFAQGHDLGSPSLHYGQYFDLASAVNVAEYKALFLYAIVKVEEHLGNDIYSQDKRQVFRGFSYADPEKLTCIDPEKGSYPVPPQTVNYSSLVCLGGHKAQYVYLFGEVSVTQPAIHRLKLYMRDG